jgi:hypothetical protein
MSPVIRLSSIVVSGLLAFGLTASAYAGNVQVTLKGGTLRVSGDREASSFSVFGFAEGGAGTMGFVRLSSQSATFNGAAGDLTFTGVNDIHVSVRNSGNAIELDGLELAGGISLKSGSGDDSVMVSDVLLGGDLSVQGSSGVLDFACNESVIGRDLIVRSGAADDHLQVDCGASRRAKLSVGNGLNSVAIELAHPFDFGALAIEGGSGGDLVTLSDSGSHTSVTGDVKIDLGGNGNVVQANRFQIAGNLTYKGGGGGDSLTGDPISVGGDARLTLGGGDNAVFLTDSHILGLLSVSGGAGVDAVEFMGTTTAGSTQFHLGGGVNSHP